MFNLTDETVQADGRKPIFPLGISEGNELTSVEKSMSDASKGESVPYLVYTFTHSDGSQVKKFEFGPKDSDKQNDPEAWAKKVKNITKRTKHILSKFGVDMFNAPDFNTLADNVVAVLNGKTNGIKLRVKTTYDYQGKYISIPSYLPFVELQTEAPTKLRIQTEEQGGLDKMTRAEEDNDSSIMANLATPVSAAPAATNSSADSGLPF